MDPRSRAIRQMYRTDLTSFIRLAFDLTQPQRRYQHHWSIESLGAALSRCVSGQTQRLILNLPPRYLKSFCASVALPAWALAQRPQMKIMCVAGNAGLAGDQHRMTRQLMSHPKFLALFPHLRGWRERGRTIHLPQGGQRSAHVLTPGSGMTGRGADLVIIDDPLPVDYADDAARRRQVNTWYDRNIYQRLDDKHTGAVIVVMQRLAPDDLTGHLLAQGRWERLCLPAVATADEHAATFHLPGNRLLRRKGEALNPSRENLAQLQDVMLRIKARAFKAQYQQDPYPEGEGVTRGGVLHFWPEPRTLVVQDEQGNDVELACNPVPVFVSPTPEERFLLRELFHGRETAVPMACAPNA